MAREIDELVSSEVATFFANKNIFITGGTGFVGKVLVYKLLKSCPKVANIYLLVRAKRGVAPEERLRSILELPLYVGLTNLSKIKLVEGDVSLPGIGLSPADSALLCQQVHVVIHSAATLKFDEELKCALSLNVDGTRQMLLLAEKMGQLKAFVHVSTAYAHCNRKNIEERIYMDQRLSYDRVMRQIEAGASTKSILSDWPNTYTFTKAMAEQMLQGFEGRLPLAVVRPSIVTATHKEPFPGWVDNMNGATGIISGVAMGMVRSLNLDRTCLGDFIPVDTVIRLLCVVARTTDKNFAAGVTNIPVYNCTSGGTNPITWGSIAEIIVRLSRSHPSHRLLWFPFLNTVTTRPVFRVIRYLIQTLPAVVVDGLLTVVGKKPWLRNLYSKIYRQTDVLEYFSTRSWTWNNDNTNGQLEVMTKKAKEDFAFDLVDLDWTTYISDYYMGVQKHILKQDPSKLKAMSRVMMLVKTLHYLTMCFPVIMCYFAIGPLRGVLKHVRS